MYDFVKTIFPEFHSIFSETADAFGLASLLIKPVQRVLKYPLLLSELVKVCVFLSVTHLWFSFFMHSYKFIRLYHIMPYRMMISKL